jgi:ferredoxin
VYKRQEGVLRIDIKNDVLGDMYLAKPLFEADLIINAPKLKTHTSGIYTGAVKNLFGCVPGLRKAGYHKAAPNPKDFGQVLVDINEAVTPALHIMDGIIAMEGEGPTSGEVYSAKKIIISTDPLALDTVAMKMIGVDIADLPIYDAARDRNLGEWHLDNIEVLGDYDFPPKLSGFKLPKRFGSTKKQNYGFLVKLIDFLRARPKIDTRICKRCNMCVESCPVQAIDKNTKEIDHKVCIECMCCHELCVHKAVKLQRNNPVAGVMIKLMGSKYK